MCVRSFVENLLFLLPNFHGVFRSMCLEVLLSQADIRKDLYLELKDKGFHDMLTHRYVRTYICTYVVKTVRPYLIEMGHAQVT